MKMMTATEASRSFAALLDQVEQGETILVTRGGHTVARIEPSARHNGRAVQGLLTAAAEDPQFGDDLRLMRDLLITQGFSWADD